MEVLKVDPKNPDPAVVSTTADILAAGGVVIYPTDTTYGIGVDPANPMAVDKVYRMKGREAGKVFSIIVKDLESVHEVAVVNTRIEKILATYLPGPYSFLVTNANFTYCPLSAVMIRIPDLPLTQAIARSFQTPFTTTSANLSGESPAHSVDEMQESLLHPEHLIVPPDLVLDGGILPPNPPSTIVDLTSWPPKILRQGVAEFDWKQFE